MEHLKGAIRRGGSEKFALGNYSMDNDHNVLFVDIACTPNSALLLWSGEGLDVRCVRSSINISKKTFVPIMIDSSEPRHEFFQVEDVKIFLDGGPSEVQK